MSEFKGRIPQEIIDEVIERTDIVDIVGRYVPLKKQGQNFTGLCPFHNEKTPSFSVSPSKQIFHCFGCGVGGNVFKFLMEIEHLTFPEAVQKLAGEVGVKIPVREQSESERRAKEKYNRLLKWNEYAAFYYQAVLHSANGNVYNAYLKKREISEDTITTFKLGACLDSWDGLYRYLKKKGASDHDLVELGLVSTRQNSKGCYDRFRERLIFPIKDANGHVVAFGGRVLNTEKVPQKYLNSPDSNIFHKGRMVYGLDLSKSSIRALDQVLIVEGYMDVIACHQAGIKNCVAPLGTALTEEQIKLLMRYTYHFVTSFDGDSAGVRATMKSIDLIENAGGEVRVLAIPENKDPDEYIKVYGVEAFEELLKNAISAFSFRLEQFYQQHANDGSNQKLAVLREIIPYLAKVRHSAELEMDIQYTANRLFLSEQSIKNELEAYRRHGYKQTEYRRFNEKPASEEAVSRERIYYPKNEILLLNGIVTYPELCETIEKSGGGEIFQSPLKEVYESFKNQYIYQNTIDASYLDVELSSMFAEACMQQKAYSNDNNEITINKVAYEQAILELQYGLIDRKYQVVLDKIRAIEQSGQFNGMEEAMSELEQMRQHKNMLKDKMRGDKQ